jgi:hypothetical protein
VIDGYYIATVTPSNIYKSKLNNAYYEIRFTRPFVNAPGGIAGGNRNLIQFGTWGYYGLIYTSHFGALTPEETYRLDKKIDNGIANTGKFYGVDGYNVAASPGSCSYSRDLVTGSATYNMTNTNNVCVFMYAIEF